VSTIGRSAENRFVLDGPRVSRFHAALFVSTDGACHLQDMGSKNGTFVEKHRVGRLRLKPGDRFHLGPYACEAMAVNGAAARPLDPSTARGTEPGDETAADPEGDGTFL